MSEQKLLSMRLRPEDRVRLETVVRHHGIAATSVIRMLLKREADAVEAVAKTANQQAISP